MDLGLSFRRAKLFLSIHAFSWAAVIDLMEWLSSFTSFEIQ